MIVKVAISSGRTYLLECEECPENPIGYRVLFKDKRGKGNTGIIVGVFKGEAQGRVDSLPDKLPLVNAKALEVTKELADHYLDMPWRILWSFIPASFDWYEEEFALLTSRSLKNLDKKSSEVVEYLKKRRKVPYETLLKRYDFRLIQLLIEHRIILKRREWVVPKVEEEFFSLNVSLEEALKRVRSKEKKELLEFISERGSVSKEELTERGFKSSHVNDLLKRGILRKEVIYPKAFNETSLRQIPPLIKRRKGNEYLSTDFRRALDFLLNLVSQNLKEGKNTLILFPSREELYRVSDELKNYFGNKVLEISARVKPKELYENWFKAFENGYVFLGSFKSLFLPFSELESILLFDEQENTKFPINGVDMRRVAYLLSQKYASELIFTSSYPRIESFLLIKKGIFRHRSEDFKPRVLIYERKGEVITEETYNFVKDRIKERTLFVVVKHGYSYAYCPRCESLAECPECGSLLTFSKEKGELFCPRVKKHYRKDTLECPSCGGELNEMGFGIERAREVVEELFGKRENFSFTTNLKWFEEWDNVVILNADTLLSVPSYRSKEKFLNIILKGLRIAKKNLVIQSGLISEEEKELIQNKNFEEIFERELKRRKEENLPPFSRLVVIESEQELDDFLKEKVSENFFKIYEEFKGVYRYMLKFKQRKLPEGLKELKGRKNVRIIFD